MSWPWWLLRSEWLGRRSTALLDRLLTVSYTDRLAYVGTGDDHAVLPRLRWLPCMKRIRQAGRSVSISPSPWSSACSSATLPGGPPAIAGCRELRRPSRTPETRLQMGRDFNGTTGGTRPGSTSRLIAIPPHLEPGLRRAGRPAKQAAASYCGRAPRQRRG